MNKLTKEQEEALIEKMEYISVYTENDYTSIREALNEAYEMGYKEGKTKGYSDGYNDCKIVNNFQQMKRDNEIFKKQKAKLKKPKEIAQDIEWKIGDYAVVIDDTNFITSYKFIKIYQIGIVDIVDYQYNGEFKSKDLRKPTSEELEKYFR